MDKPSLAHHKGDGFINPWDSYRREHAKTSASIISKTKHEASKEDIAAIQLLAQRPNFKLAEPAFLETRRNVGVTWIGHATFVLQMYGLTILTDPNWNSKTHSPFSFGGVKRLVPPPVSVSDLPKIDVVVITADRADKCDKSTIRELGNRCKYVVPLGVGETLQSYGITRENIIELDWWQEETMNGVKIVCCPAQHVSGQQSLDGRCSALWCSWAFIGVRAKVYFVGSSGYRAARRGQSFLPYKERLEIPCCPAFREIGKKLGPFDLAFLPVGNFTPRHSVSCLQMDPLDAVCVHRDVGARQSTAHSWGTFVIGSEEETLEPLRLLEQAMMQVGVSDSEFVVTQHGVTKVMY
mmetsp:Transcript_8008/g.14243  ORF Transcript_8008/g.14243 Transcript_8008/m.14243 type:complete len:352 (-) Transcript_8008:130-1185(-)